VDYYLCLFCDRWKKREKWCVTSVGRGTFTSVFRALYSAYEVYVAGVVYRDIAGLAVVLPCQVDLVKDENK
jgi:hypothetical protein